MSNHSDLEMIQDAAVIAYSVFVRTDFESIDAHRDLDDEFASRIGSAAHTNTVASFAQRLADKWGVRSLADHEGDARSVIHKYDEGDGDARSFLRVVRNHKALVPLEMREQFMDTDNSEDSE
jgi:hypothetical protein